LQYLRVATRPSGWNIYGKRCYCVFFFQAEDGIRDPLVTGVQTCALPISSTPTERANIQETSMPALKPTAEAVVVLVTAPPNTARSEERRVGKECRARGSRE